ncbi:Concanavalin A-like lectin/glucanase, subgroup [Mycena venus]|uniref:Concanavalin A-like lectin/glucanase, subgroup n=1 Tax=Mycena venus TaxID=2733690 RepID=A0A8H6X8R6_9AGAR|nr:Concanavalin A-like lectin/glucanase, subgroup [Mycena venus]
MQVLHLFALFTFASAKLLLSYNASAGDPASVLGQQNLQGWDRATWPAGQKQNASAFFTTATDPNGVPAAHVHKDAHFIRSEYHMLVEKTAADQTYYIGYHVSFGTGVDYESCPIVFQWKNYNPDTVDTDDIPVLLAFQKGSTADQYIISFAAEADPSADDLLSQETLWTKEVTHGTAYRFGIVINTSATSGFVQLYFNGKLSTMISPSTGEHTTKYSGNFFPGRSEPKVGLYGGQATNACDSYIYNVVIGTTLADIADVADIST